MRGAVSGEVGGVVLTPWVAEGEVAGGVVSGEVGEGDAGVRGN